MNESFTMMERKILILRVTLQISSRFRGDLTPESLLQYEYLGMLHYDAPISRVERINPMTVRWSMDKFICNHSYFTSGFVITSGG
jgi:hypothetical protein